MRCFLCKIVYNIIYHGSHNHTVLASHQSIKMTMITMFCLFLYIRFCLDMTNRLLQMQVKNCIRNLLIVFLLNSRFVVFIQKIEIFRCFEPDLIDITYFQCDLIGTIYFESDPIGITYFKSDLVGITYFEFDLLRAYQKQWHQYLISLVESLNKFPFFYVVIEKTMLYFSMLFNHSSANLIIIKFNKNCFCVQLH